MDSNDGINSEDVRFNREASFQFDIMIYLCMTAFIGQVHIQDKQIRCLGFRCWFSGSSRKKPEFSALWDFFSFQQFVSESVSWNYYRQLHSDYMSVDYKNGKTCIYIVDVDCQNHIPCLSKYYELHAVCLTVRSVLSGIQ